MLLQHALTYQHKTENDDVFVLMVKQPAHIQTLKSDYGLIE